MVVMVEWLLRCSVWLLGYSLWLHGSSTCCCVFIRVFYVVTCILDGCKVVLVVARVF